MDCALYLHKLAVRIRTILIVTIDGSIFVAVAHRDVNKFRGLPRKTAGVKGNRFIRVAAMTSEKRKQLSKYYTTHPYLKMRKLYNACKYVFPSSLPTFSFPLYLFAISVGHNAPAWARVSFVYLSLFVTV